MIAETERIIIRKFIPSDFNSLYALMSDPDTMKFTGFKVPQTRERTKELLSKWEQEGQQGLGVWSVVEKNTNFFIGWVMLKLTNTKHPELGYMIYKPYSGKGYATEIAKTMLEYGFKKLKLPKIIAVTSPENYASIRVLEKSGMKRAPELTHTEGGIYFIADSIN